MRNKNRFLIQKNKLPLSKFLNSVTFFCLLSDLDVSSTQTGVNFDKNSLKKVDIKYLTFRAAVFLVVTGKDQGEGKDKVEAPCGKFWPGLSGLIVRK